MVTFEGRWKYQSYRPEPGSVAADPTTPPTFVRWSPPGEVTVDADGAKLVLKGVPFPLILTFQITDGNPARLSISAVGERPDKKLFTNELQGWFVPATLKLGEVVDENTPLVVRGSIVQTSEDIHPTDPQPRFTTGFFVLVPLKPD